MEGEGEEAKERRGHWLVHIFMGTTMGASLLRCQCYPSARHQISQEGWKLCPNPPRVDLDVALVVSPVRELTWRWACSALFEPQRPQNEPDAVNGLGKHHHLGHRLCPARSGTCSTAGLGKSTSGNEDARVFLAAASKPPSGPVRARKFVLRNQATSESPGNTRPRKAASINVSIPTTPQMHSAQNGRESSRLVNRLPNRHHT